MDSTIVQCEAPNRILDFGGWSDTHFAGSGKVLNFAVSLYANVTVVARKGGGVKINVLDYGETIEAAHVGELEYNNQFDLLKAALKVMEIGQGIEVHISADVPPGCGTGSSAAVSVALITALGLLKDEPLAPYEAARLAHRIETEELGLECGIQDQLASAMGGVSYIDMYDYPNARVSQMPVPERMIDQLNSQLLVVYEGAAHLSSEVHSKVIENLKDPKSPQAQALEALKTIAQDAKTALLKGDMAELAELTNRNYDLQTQLHPDIATEQIRKIREIALKRGAAAIKINGAGGGGSVTLLCKPAKKAVVMSALKRAGFAILPCRLSLSPAKAWFVQ